ncbi:MAG: HAD-IC family P-type ATPase [Patescibacteria group bacterium]
MLSETKDNWYSLEKTELKKTLKTDFKNGLTAADVLERQRKGGKNVLTVKRQITFWLKFITHLKSPLVFVLIGAGLVAVILGQFLDALVIFLVVIINLAVGIFQENKADQAFEKLNTAQKKYATVLRGGALKVVLASELVRGDIVILTAGVSVPADLRIFEAKDLSVNEAVLTGEWLGATKNARPILEKEVALKNQSNMVWMGTLISAGYGKGAVVETGKKTQLGKISESLSDFEESTPLKRKINKIVRFLFYIVLLSVAVIFGAGIYQGETYLNMFLIVIAIAIAVVPEGLPIALTSVLAVGMKKVLKKGGLIKNLLASETLGNVSVILTDKTGTLTEAEMKLSHIFTRADLEEDRKEILTLAVISSDAFIETGEGNKLIIRGRPLEKAIIAAGLEQGAVQSDLKNEHKRLDLLLFSSDNGYAVSLNQTAGKENKIYVSGRPGALLEKSKFILKNGRTEKINSDDIGYFKRVLREKTNQGARVTAVAFAPVAWKKIPDQLPANLVFGGLLAFDDPLRKDARQSVGLTKELGIRTIMLTGDNEGTARKIAEEAGIIGKGGRVLVGSILEKMSDKELNAALDEADVFAEMTPAQKLRVSKILKEKGEVVAMTGDGINDAPALKNADVGIAVESGTEVAKEAADMILLNNSFSVIVFAIEEGRRIIDNLKKIVAYLLSTSFSEVFVIGGALFMGFPLPILAPQILWINIIEEGLMNFAFVFEPKEKYIKSRDFFSANQEILTARLKRMILTTGLITGLFVTGLYFILVSLNLPPDRIRTIVFAALSVDSLFIAFSLKSLYQPIWKINLFSNRFLIGAWLSSMGMILAALYVPFLQVVLRTIPLDWSDLALVFGVGLFNLILIEITKYLFFEKNSGLNNGLAIS